MFFFLKHSEPQHMLGLRVVGKKGLESGTVILEVKDGKYEPIQDCDVLKM